MKRIISVLLSFAIMLTALCVPAFAEGGTGGSGNIDGGGGSMGNATSHGSWNPGNEGVRITVVRASDHAVVTTPFDLTNKQPAAGIYHFGKVSKIQYNGGAALSPVQGGYGTITGCSGYHIVPFTGQYFPRTESAALWWHYGYCRPKTFTKNQSEENCSGSQGR